MNKYLFITHFTPLHKRSLLRKRLLEEYFNSLNNQTYNDWKVLILGEEEKTEGKYKYIRLSDNKNRDEKESEIVTLYARSDVEEYLRDVNYIIKLDDDDIISPTILEHTSKLNFDCYYDNYHTFFDITSGVITQQKRDWYASTCIHKKEHAFAPYNGHGSSLVGNLFYSHHSYSWHQYYKDKKNSIADKYHPVYLRILSPTSITSSTTGMPIKEYSDVSLEKYFTYLRTFGNWDKVNVNNFDFYLDNMRKYWIEFSGKDWQKIPTISNVHQLQNKFLNLWRKL